MHYICRRKRRQGFRDRLKSPVPNVQGPPPKSNDDDRTFSDSSFLAHRQCVEPYHRRLRVGQHHRHDPALCCVVPALGAGRDGAPRGAVPVGAMALFFVPYGVGLMDSYRVILENLWAILVSGIVSTILVLIVARPDLPEPEPPRPPAAHQTTPPRCLTPHFSPRTSFC